MLAAYISAKKEIIMQKEGVTQSKPQNKKVTRCFVQQHAVFSRHPKAHAESKTIGSCSRELDYMTSLYGQDNSPLVVQSSSLEQLPIM